MRGSSWPFPPPTVAPVGVPAGPPGKIEDALDPPAKPARATRTKAEAPAVAAPSEIDSRPGLPF